MRAREQEAMESTKAPAGAEAFVWCAILGLNQ